MTRLLVCAAFLVLGFRATPAAAQFFEGPAYGRSGTGPGEFHEPKGIAFQGSELFVVDSGNSRIQVFDGYLAPDDSLKLVREWGAPGQGPGEFNQPSDIDGVGYGEDLFVSDTGNHRIQKFSSNGAFLAEWGTYGSEDGQLDSPTFLNVSGGFLFVSDTGNKRVQVFRADGTFVRIIGGPGDGPGQFQSPAGIYAEGDVVLVADAVRDRVLTFDPEGAFLGEGPNFPSESILQGISNEAAFFVDAGRNVVFDTGGHSYGWQTSSDGPLNSPFDIAFQCCYIGVVSDTGNDRIVTFFLPDPVAPTTWGRIKARYE